MGIRTEVRSTSNDAASRKIKTADAIIPRQAQWPLYITSLVIFDAAATFLAFWLAYYLRFELFVQYFDPTAVVSFERYRLLLYSVPFLWLGIFAVNGLYVRGNLLGGTREYSMVFGSASTGFFLIVLVGFLEPTLIIARGWLLLAWGNTFLFVSISRHVLRRVVYALRRRGFFVTPAVIVGANQEGRQLAEQLLRWETSGLHLIGFVDKKVPATFPLFHGLVSLGSVDKLDQIIEQ